MSTHSTSEPISLHFQDHVRVAGEVIQGRVDLNVALAQKDGIEHLRIKFRGSIETTIKRSAYNGVAITDTPYKQNVSLFRMDKTLWDSGTTPGAHALEFPFQFQLPEGLPPSFHCSAPRHSAVISYSLEIVGDRPGLFHRNRRVRRLISVVPAASTQQLLAKESLKQGFRGAWKLIGIDKKMRKGILGDYSYAKIELQIPDSPSFPIATDIPFRFHVVTHTKSMRHSERPVDKHGELLFPAPPALFSDVALGLLRKTNIKASPFDEVDKEVFKLNALGDATSLAAVRVIDSQEEWLPDPNSKDHGIWKREIQFESAVALNFAPTSVAKTVDWQYKLCFEVPFPGMGNDLKLEVPIHLDPGSAGRPVGWSHGDLLSPTMQDLPPSYWGGDHHDHDSDDEKK
ncbi:hypothetical protein C8J57DRAFT_1707461 [Mycena rebaudengoi]|nr:hypothetical protein C8J57DRAFT_1707461 [Mycena rebaudengoi]